MQQLNKSFIRPFIIFTLIALGFLLTSCGSDSTTQTSTSTTTAPNATAGTGSLEHYMCPNGHVGSGAGAAGNCSQCNTALVHNPNFHKNDPPAAPPTSPQVNALSPILTTPSAPGTVVNPSPNQTQTITPPKNEPPQNAAGVWHYTCPSGCAGGGGSATACASCGTTLAHNTEYH